MLQCKVQQQYLIPALELVKACLAQKSQLNRKDFIIQGHEQGLVLLACNGLSALRLFVPAEMNDHVGTVCLPSQHVLEIVKVAGEEIAIEQTESQLVISSGQTESRVNIKDATELPPFPELEKVQPAEVDAVQLGLCLSQTIGSTSKENENMYALTSLAVAYEGSKAKITGCNGHKMIISDLDLTGEGINLSNQPALVPREGAILISKLVKPHKTVKWGFGEKQLIVSTPAAQLVTFLTSGEYPNTKAIVDSVSSPNTLEVSQQEFISALRRAMIFTDEFSSISFMIESNKISMVSKEDTVGSAAESIAATFSGGEKVELPLNPRYVMDILSLMKPTDTVEMQLTNGQSPVIIRPQGNNSLFSLIMPVQR